MVNDLLFVLIAHLAKTLRVTEISQNPTAWLLCWLDFSLPVFCFGIRWLKVVANFLVIMIKAEPFNWPGSERRARKTSLKSCQLPYSVQGFEASSGTQWSRPLFGWAVLDLPGSPFESPFECWVCITAKRVLLSSAALDCFCSTICRISPPLGWVRCDPSLPKTSQLRLHTLKVPSAVIWRLRPSDAVRCGGTSKRSVPPKNIEQLRWSTWTRWAWFSC